MVNGSAAEYRREELSATLYQAAGLHELQFETRRFDEDLQKVSNQIRNYYLLSFKPGAASAPGLHSNNGFA